jgi:hypothetical protein
MTNLRVLAASLAVVAGTVGVAPTATAGHVVVGIGIGLPGIAIVAPAPVAMVPSYYYGPGYYGPVYYAGLRYGSGYYGRPYARYAPRGYGYAYAGGGHRFH